MHQMQAQTLAFRVRARQPCGARGQVCVPRVLQRYPQDIPELQEKEESMSRTESKSLCYALSDWEVFEARQDFERGVPIKMLAERYGVADKTLQRAFKRMDEREGDV